jgi:hypothetical protein
LDWHESTSAAHFWRELSNIYGISTAEERLMTVKALLDLHPQGDYVSMLYDYQHLVAKLKQMKITLEDLFHNIFIYLLGQWQAGFVRTHLDKFFACGRGPI